jgi:TonB family protein
MADENQIIVSPGGGAVIRDKAVLRQIRGSFFEGVDPRFFVIMAFSLIIHAAGIYMMNRVKLPPAKPQQIEDMSDRFVRLIIEKPLPKQLKEKLSKAQDGGVKADDGGKADAAGEGQKSAESVKKAQTVAKKNVAARVAKVEKKIRTVGVLGLLTGAGATATGPAVVDVLGKAGKKERFQDFELALSQSDGLIKTESKQILEQKLVQSKEVDIVNRREEIDDLLSDVKATTKDLVKIGHFVLRAPESIEGAASSNAKRDEKAISAIVNRNKIGVKMTYEKYLKRDPNLEGKITVRFTISPAGIVTTVMILENTTGNLAFESELIRKIKMWRFEEISEGDVTVTYPFLFSAS